MTRLERINMLAEPRIPDMPDSPLGASTPMRAVELAKHARWLLSIVRRAEITVTDGQEWHPYQDMNATVWACPACGGYREGRGAGHKADCWLVELREEVE